MSLTGLARLTREQIAEAFPQPLLSKGPLLESWGFLAVVAMWLFFLFAYVTISGYYRSQNCVAALKATGLSQAQSGLIERICR